jgi:NitT/TauT family transport system permease protein
LSLEENAAASLYRSFRGLVLAVAAAVPAGLMLGWDRRIGEFVDPLLEIFRNTAALALPPVFTLILGIGETCRGGTVTRIRARGRS